MTDTEIQLSARRVCMRMQLMARARTDGRAVPADCLEEEYYYLLDRYGATQETRLGFFRVVGRVRRAFEHLTERE